MMPPRFGSIRHRIQDETLFEEFQDSSQSSWMYQNGTVISSNTESPFCPDAFHQVSTQSFFDGLGDVNKEIQDGS